jgi:hypothetical protein
MAGWPATPTSLNKKPSINLDNVTKLGILSCSLIYKKTFKKTVTTEIYM